MTRDNTAIDNSSDIVRRTMSILINDSMPKAEQIVYLEQSLTALASFTTGDAARADQLRELCTQLQRTIDAIEQSLSAASRRFAQVSVRGRTEFARSTSETWSDVEDAAGREARKTWRIAGPCSMIRETRKLLAALGAMNQQIPGVCLGIMDESLSVAKQAEFGELLVELGEAMQTHAQSQRVQLIEIKTETSDSPGSSSPGSQEHTE